MSKLAYSFASLIDTKTFTISGSATLASGTPIGNLVNPRMETGCVFEGATSVNIDWDHGSAYSYGFVALLGHTLPAGATVVVKGADNSGYSTNVVTFGTRTTTRTTNHEIFRVTDTTTKRYWRIQITGAVAPFAVGRVYAGAAVEILRNVEWGFSFANRSRTEINVTDGGGVYPVERIAEQFLAVDFKEVPESEMSEITGFLLDCGQWSTPFIFWLADAGYYCRMGDDYAYNRTPIRSGNCEIPTNSVWPVFYDVVMPEIRLEIGEAEIASVEAYDKWRIYFPSALPTDSPIVIDGVKFYESSARTGNFIGGYVSGTIVGEWVQPYTNLGGIIHGIAYGNGVFVAVAAAGSSNLVAVSIDGISWTSGAYQAENNPWVSLVFGGGLFVAVAGTGTNRIMTSPDGVTWTPRSFALAKPWKSIAYGNGVFVAVAMSGNQGIISSTNGIDWSGRNPGFTNDEWASVAYGNGVFVAIATTGDNKIVTSTDGTTWTLRTKAGTWNFTDVSFANNRFYISDNTSANLYYPLTSTDGITWTQLTSNFANWKTKRFFYGNGIYFAVGGTYASQLQSSTDGLNFSDISSYLSQIECFGFLAINGIFLFSNGTSIWYKFSDRYHVTDYLQSYGDAENIFKLPLSDNNWTSNVVSNAGAVGQYVGLQATTAVNVNSLSINLSLNTAYPATAILQKSNSSYWNSVATISLSPSFSNLTWGINVVTAEHSSPTKTPKVAWDMSLGKFIASLSNDTNGYTSSTNGTTWTPEANFSGVWNGVVNRDASLVIYGSTGTVNNIIMKVSGTWVQKATSYTDSNWRGACYSNYLKKLVIVGDSNRTLSLSSNSTSFVDNAGPTNGGGWLSVCYSEHLHKFVAVSGANAYGNMMYSVTGSTWTLINTQYNNYNINTVLFDEETAMFYALASPFIILRSSDGDIWEEIYTNIDLSATKMVYASDLKLFFVLVPNSKVYVTDGVSTPTLVKEFAAGRAVSSIAWSPQLNCLAVGMAMNSAPGTSAIEVSSFIKPVGSWAHFDNVQA